MVEVRVLRQLKRRNKIIGTSATIRFKHEGDNNTILVNVYHHYDGYIEGVGHDLAEFLLSKKIVNGITCFDDMNTIANGFSCLIAQYISNVKKGPGEVYICLQDFEGDYNYDVIYNDCKNEIYIKVTHYDKVLFKGSPKELLEYKDKEDEEEINMTDVELVIKLPKGHGRLFILDEESLKEFFTSFSFSCQKWISEVGISNATLKVIEADKEDNK